MAYPTPQYLYPYAGGYTPPQAQNSAQPADTGLIWVQGVEGAKSYLVAPNKTVLLMDSENEQFFLKSADASGMPLPLRVFKYTELVSKEKNGNYVTKAEYDELLKKLNDLESKLSHKEVDADGEPVV